MKYALYKDSIVVNIIVAEESFLLEHPELYDTYEEATDETRMGQTPTLAKAKADRIKALASDALSAGTALLETWQNPLHTPWRVRLDKAMCGAYDPDVDGFTNDDIKNRHKFTARAFTDEVYRCVGLIHAATTVGEVDAVRPEWPTEIVSE